MTKNYMTSVNGWSTKYENREDAIAAAQRANQMDEDANIKVYNSFHNVIWEN